MKFLSVIAISWFACGVCNAEQALVRVAVAGDLPTLERGAETVIDNCTVCHSLKYIKFRDLVTFGMAGEKVDAWRGDNPLSSAIISKMTTSSAMQAFGAIPPDLSLMVKAREGGANYVYSYLLGFYETSNGMPANHYFQGTKMPDVFGISGVADDSQRVKIEQKARDVVSFLTWAADPQAQERHTLGYYVIGYLLVLTILLYFLKQRIWARLNISSNQI